MTNRFSRVAPLTGVVFVVLLLISIFLPGSLPDGDASGANVIAYAKDNHTKLNVDAAIIGFSLFVGLFFYGQLRAFLRRIPDNEALASIAFGGAVLFTAGGGVIAGTQLALAESSGSLEPGAAQALNMMARDLAMVLFAGLAVLMVAAGLAPVRSRILATWLGWVGIMFGVVTVAGSFHWVPGCSSLVRFGHWPSVSS